jgi:hypothetical protein
VYQGVTIMAFDATTDIVNHFIGIFATVVEEVRLRHAYDEFKALKKLDAEFGKLLNVKVTIDSPYSSGGFSTSFSTVQQAALVVEPLRFVAQDTSELPPIYILTGLSNFVRQSEGEVRLPPPGPEFNLAPASSVLSVTVQLNTLSDNDIYGDIFDEEGALTFVAPEDFDLQTEGMMILAGSLSGFNAAIVGPAHGGAAGYASYVAGMLDAVSDPEVEGASVTILRGAEALGIHENGEVVEELTVLEDVRPAYFHPDTSDGEAPEGVETSEEAGLPIKAGASEKGEAAATSEDNSGDKGAAHAGDPHAAHAEVAEHVKEVAPDDGQTTQSDADAAPGDAARSVKTQDFPHGEDVIFVAAVETIAELIEAPETVLSAAGADVEERAVTAEVVADAGFGEPADVEKVIEVLWDAGAADTAQGAFAAGEEDVALQQDSTGAADAGYEDDSGYEIIGDNGEDSGTGYEGGEALEDHSEADGGQSGDDLGDSDRRGDDPGDGDPGDNDQISDGQGAGDLDDNGQISDGQGDDDPGDGSLNDGDQGDGDLADGDQGSEGPDNNDTEENDEEDDGSANSFWDVEDGHAVVAGANQQLNEVSVQSAWLDAPVIAVMGDVAVIDAISQVNVLFEASIGSAEAVMSQSYNSASIIETATTVVDSDAEADGDDDGPGRPDMPEHWVVTRVDGDLIQVNWIEQFNFATDQDMARVEFSGDDTLIQLGDNSLMNLAEILEIGFGYDLIMVGGAMVSVNLISQVNALLDIDSISYEGSGPDSVSMSDNLLFNSAVIDATGVDNWVEMDVKFANAGHALAAGSKNIGASVAKNEMFDGIDVLRVLYIEGDWLTINSVAQTNILGDADQVHLALEDFVNKSGGEVSITTGSNSLVNLAEVVDYGVDSTVMVGGEVYSDALIYQAELIDTDADPSGVALTALANEAVAFLAPDIIEDTLPDGVYTSTIIETDSTSADILQTMLA